MPRHHDLASNVDLRMTIENILSLEGGIADGAIICDLLLMVLPVSVEGFGRFVAASAVWTDVSDRLRRSLAGHRKVSPRVCRADSTSPQRKQSESHIRRGKA